MKLAITDVHGAHGLTFKLTLKPENSDDNMVFEQLQKLVSGEYLQNGKSALYSYEISANGNQIEIGLAEEMKSMAKIDYLWNSSREDQKFVVLMLQGDPENYEWTFDKCPHFECHWCHQETWGVNRKTVEVYSPKEKKIIMVSVHDECQEKREKQIAMIPYAESTND